MKNPLITIIVVTYNSEQFVLKTLNSILAQNYKNLQIIISDDHSVDNTIYLCKDWILKNSTFCEVHLLQSDENRGTANNINKALPFVKGEYLKIIAGDDEFCDNYFFECIDYFSNNVDCNIVSTNVTYIYEDIGKEILNQPFSSFLQTNQLGNDEMYRTIIRYNVIFSPTCMMKTDLIRTFGGFDERFPLCEDLFFYAKILKSGNRIHFIDKCMIKYRIHNKSVQSKSNIKVFSKYDNDLVYGKKELFWQDYAFFERFLEKIQLFFFQKIISRGNDLRFGNRMYLAGIYFVKIILRLIRISYYLNIVDRKH